MAMIKRISDKFLEREGKKKYVVVGEGIIYLKESAGFLSLPMTGDIIPNEERDIFNLTDELDAVSKESISVCHVDLVPFPIRDLLSYCSVEEYRILSRGVELINWSNLYQHCPNDGQRLLRAIGISKICDVCGREYFPTLSPAIVVLVMKEEEALLVQPFGFKKDIMALVAGFVETGENLEECVKREVKEETGIEIGEVHYYGSQSWPFPYQLMVGFTARYESGDVKFEDGEIKKGGFFSRSAPPDLPGLPSLSRKIIDDWLSGKIS